MSRKKRFARKTIRKLDIEEISSNNRGIEVSGRILEWGGPINGDPTMILSENAVVTIGDKKFTRDSVSVVTDERTYNASQS